MELLSTMAADDGAAGLALAQARLDQGLARQALRLVQRGARRWPRMGRWALLSDPYGGMFYVISMPEPV